MDPIITQSPLTGTPPSGTPDDEEPVGVTVEERDEFWRKRLGGHQRGWNAERQALREQNASLEARLKALPATGQDGQPGTDQSAAEVARLQRELEQRDTLYGRKVKYQSLNGNVSDAVVMASDEAELARLNALFDDTPPTGGVIAPTQPKRGTGTAPKRIEEMSKDELLLELQRESNRLVESRRSGF